MHPKENHEEKKKIDLRSQPLCLFCFPEELSLDLPVRQTYVNVLPKREPSSSRKKWSKERTAESHQRPEETRSKGKDDFWPRRRTEARTIRRKIKEPPIRNLKSYLLTSVKYEKVPEKALLPSLFEVLETVKDAWPTPPPPPPLLLPLPLPPPPPRRNFSFYGEKNRENPSERNKMLLSKTKMKEEMYLQFPSPLINRRFSVPEELMRRYFIMKEKTSEESETIKTTDEVTPMTTSTMKDAPSREKSLVEKSGSLSNLKTAKNHNEKMVDACQQTTDESLVPVPRVGQTDLYVHEKNVTKIKNGKSYHECDMCTCRCDKHSIANVSGKEADDSVTTDSVPSPPPVQVRNPESLSDNMSSESDYIQCTCRELTSSKETSSDVFNSGKSTLSQTVSEKSLSTQDSTVSVKSLSTAGSTVTDNSNATTPDLEKTSAKESSECSPRSPRTNMNRKNRRRDRYHHVKHKKFCPRYQQVKHSQRSDVHSSQCLLYSKSSKDVTECRNLYCTNTGYIYHEPFAEINDIVEEGEAEEFGPSDRRGEQEEDVDEKHGRDLYRWAKLSQDELYMMQQLRHQKHLKTKFREHREREQEKETERSDTISIEYEDGDNKIEESIMIPRYSALPRSLSMLVNTSSAENSFQNSDSDNQSLADSLEDQPVVAGTRRFYFDTKKESKPVRGDVNLVEQKPERPRIPKGKAFFVNIKDPLKEDTALEGLGKILELPEKIKNQISERHLNITTKHKHLNEGNEEEKTPPQKKRKARRVKNEGKGEKLSKSKTTHAKERGEDGVKTGNGPKERKSKREENVREETIKQGDENDKKQKKNGKQTESREDPMKTSKRKKEVKGRHSSKIPVLVSSRSTSSPEREGNSETPSIQSKLPQVLEMTHSDTGTTPKPPQVVRNPENPKGNVRVIDKNQLMVPVLLPTMKMQYRPLLNRAQHLSQMRRSPVFKYRQQFEVIPEERSSSLSSAEEKSTEETAPKFASTATSPLPLKQESSESVKFDSYELSRVPDIIFEHADGQDKDLKALPYVKGADNQKIILFSSKPQNSNSRKGRDALIAMNREDFNRLAKGWMNFYKLKEFSDMPEIDSRRKKPADREGSNNSKTTASTGEEGKGTWQGGDRDANPKNEKKNNNNNAEGRERVDNLSYLMMKKEHNRTADEIPETFTNKNKTTDADGNIRLQSSNAILRTVKTISPSDSTRLLSKKQSYLPDLNLPQERIGEGHRLTSTASTNLTLPQVVRHPGNSESDSESDSTDYMEPPTPKVPPLLLEEFPSDATLSSSDSELEDLPSQVSNNPAKPPQLKKRLGTNRTRFKKDFFESSRIGKKKNSGWSVTVAGTVELSKSAPNLEMRLSFPKNAVPPLVCQSDSGFAEDSNYSKLSESMQDLKVSSSRRDSSLSSSGSHKPKWTMTVQNPKQGGVENPTKSKLPKNPTHLLPNLESPQIRNAKKVIKRVSAVKSFRRLVTKKLYNIWPKVQKIIQKEFFTNDEGFMTDPTEEQTPDETCLLYVKGTAMSLEKKEKPLTMTERDVTRRDTPRISAREH